MIHAQRQKKNGCFGKKPEISGKKKFCVMIDYQKKWERSKRLSLKGVHYCKQGLLAAGNP